MVADLNAEYGELSTTDSTPPLSETLYAQVSGEGAPLILLHGLFGMGSNLGGLGRHLSSGFTVHQLDLPNHGRSPWYSPMNLSQMAKSVEGYMDSCGLQACHVLGHSLGGKVAMQLALSSPRRVCSVVAADIAPVKYPRSHDAVFAGIDAVRCARPANRQIARELLLQHIEEPAVAQFLLLSLRRDQTHYSWRFNVDAIKAHYDELLDAPALGEYEGPSLFVFGGDSTYWSNAAALAASRFFPNMQSHGIAETGHWLHAEKPAEFNAVVAHFIESADRSVERGA